MCAPANLVCTVALWISITPSAQISRTKVSSSQSKSRYETYLDVSSQLHIGLRSSVFGENVIGRWSLVVGRIVVGRRALAKTSFQPRSGRCQGRLLLRNLNGEVPGLECVGFAGIVCRCAPYRSDVHLAAVLRHLRGLATLLLDVGLDHLGDR